MKRLLMILVVLAMVSGLMVVLPGLASADPALTIDNVTVLTGPVGRFERFEASFDLSQTYDNPFDASEISVDVVFVSPTGDVQTVPAFWYQEFTASGGASGNEQYNPAGFGEWRVRFAPAEHGTYTWQITAADAVNSASQAQTPFNVGPSTERGFIRIHENNPLQFQFDDGSWYLPRGHNAAFEDGNPSFQGGTAYYSDLFESFSLAGENWTRVWMTDFNRSALEWSSEHWSGFYDGVGKYSLESAWRLDEILTDAASSGLMVQLVLNDHGQFNEEATGRWTDNPYRDVVSEPRGFFSDAGARDRHKARLRYITARWGAFTNVQAWELFNEVNFTGNGFADSPRGDPGFRSDVIEWHDDMAAYLGSVDPFGHLVTTSTHEDVLAPIWDLSGIDVIQVHDYRDPPTERNLAIRDLVAQLQAEHGKPVIFGEFGIDPSGVPEAGFDPVTFGGIDSAREHLIQGTHLHNGAWTAALSGTGAMYWWWGIYVWDDANLNRTPPDFPLNERVFPALNAYLAGEDWPALNLAPSTLTTTPGLFVVGMDNGTSAYLWVRDSENEFGSGSAPGDLAGRVISEASITIEGMSEGVYRVEVHDPYGPGGVLSQFTVPTTSPLTIDLPDFTRDVALKLEQVPPTPTGAGTDVTVVPTDTTTGTTPVEVTFSTVVSAGETALTSASAGPAVPSEFQLGDPPTFYDLSTTAVFTGPITVCITYDEAAFADESMARILHFDGGAWANATTSQDTVTNVVCGVVDSLSPFTVAESLLVSFHIEGVIDQPVPPELAATFAVGDSFAVEYTFNREAVDTFPALKQAIYTDAITTATFNVGAYGALGASGNIHVLNDWPNGPVELRDQYAATFGDLSGAAVGGFEPFDAGLQLQDYGASGGDAIPTSAGEALPTAPLDPAAFPVRFLFMSFEDPSCTFDCFPVSIQASVVSWTESITETVPPGGTVATNGTVTEENPFAASVTTPTGGEITISEGDSDPAVPSSYQVVGDFFVEITADPADPADPLILRFLVDASAWADIPLNELTVLRNGVPTPDCVVAGDSGPADPDPCVGERNILTGFDLEIVVRTSQASEWTVARPTTVTDLIGQVEAIVDAGGLKKGQAKGLLRILSNVEKSLAKNKIGDACNQLQDFIDETQSKVVEGALDEVDGPNLVSTALGLRILYEC